MDKKNTIIGISLLVAGFGLMFVMQSVQQRPRSVLPATPAEAPVAAGESPAASVIGEAVSPSEWVSGAAPAAGTVTEMGKPLGTPVSTTTPEEVYSIGNESIQVTFSTIGGGIRYVDFVHRNKKGELKYPQTLGSPIPYRFNYGASLPALALSLPDEKGDKINRFAPVYTRTARTENTIRFEHRMKNGLRIIRGYKVQEDTSKLDPYVIEHETRFVNESGEAISLPELYVNLGTAPATLGDHLGEYLNFGYNANGSTHFTRITDFDHNGGFLGIRSRAAREYIRKDSTETEPLGVTWAAVKNQFFASILTAEKRLGTGIYTAPERLELEDVELDARLRRGISGAMKFDLGTVSAKEHTFLRLQYYVGPKEFSRISGLDEERYNNSGKDFQAIMQFGFFSPLSQFMLWCIKGIHTGLQYITGSWAWGFSIITLTFLIRSAMWPLTRFQARSAKRMAELAKPINEIKERYKAPANADADTQQRLMVEQQKAMMELWKEHNINPMAGCFPILLQIPIFISLYFMLRTCSELRFSPFLWMNDLSVPDTLFKVFGFNFNLLPLLMAVAQYFQMKLTPQPTLDEMQKQIFQYMPFVFVFFCYDFPSGLVLYWTISTVYSIGQQLITNRIKDAEDIKIEKELEDTEKKKSKHLKKFKKA